MTVARARPGSFFCCSKYFGMFFCELYYESSTFAFCDQFVACNCGFQLWFARHQPSARPPQRPWRGRERRWRTSSGSKGSTTLPTISITTRRSYRAPTRTSRRMRGDERERASNERQNCSDRGARPSVLGEGRKARATSVDPDRRRTSNRSVGGHAGHKPVARR